MSAVISHIEALSNFYVHIDSEKENLEYLMNNLKDLNFNEYNDLYRVFRGLYILYNTIVHILNDYTL